MYEADSPFTAQVALLLALVLVAVAVLSAWLPRPATSDVGPGTDVDLVHEARALDEG